MFYEFSFFCLRPVRTSQALSFVGVKCVLSRNVFFIIFVLFCLRPVRTAQALFLLGEMLLLYIYIFVISFCFCSRPARTPHVLSFVRRNVSSFFCL